jgi:hypothetical protein
MPLGTGLACWTRRTGPRAQHVAGDYVDDTPQQAFPNTLACTSAFAVASPCAAAPPGAPLDSCPCRPLADDVANFMDSGPDACARHFTCGQAQRMHAAWWHFRVNATDAKLRAHVSRARLSQLQGAIHTPVNACLRGGPLLRAAIMIL